MLKFREKETGGRAEVVRRREGRGEVWIGRGSEDSSRGDDKIKWVGRRMEEQVRKVQVREVLVWALKGKRVQVRRARKLQTIFLTL